MLRINWSRFRLEDCHIKLHPENLPFRKSSFSLVTPEKYNTHLELKCNVVMHLDEFKVTNTLE